MSSSYYSGSGGSGFSKEGSLEPRRASAPTELIKEGYEPRRASAPTGSLAYRRYLQFLPQKQLEQHSDSSPELAQLHIHSSGSTSDGVDGVHHTTTTTSVPLVAAAAAAAAGSDGGASDISNRKSDGDNIPDVISVRRLVLQYTSMLQAKQITQSKSCVDISPAGETRRRGSGRAGVGTRLFLRRQSRGQGSDSAESDSPTHCESDHYSRWASEPHLSIMAGSPLQLGQEIGQSSNNALVVHGGSLTCLTRLDSGGSDEGCPRDGSTGPSSPPHSPYYHGGTSPRTNLMGLITPFRALSPASTLVSPMDSCEDIPLARSASLGHVLDYWHNFSSSRAHSADSAVEVEEEESSHSELSDLLSKPACDIVHNCGHGADQNLTMCGDGAKSDNTECDIVNYGAIESNINTLSDCECRDRDNNVLLRFGDECAVKRRRERGPGRRYRNMARSDSLDDDLLLRRGSDSAVMSYHEKVGRSDSLEEGVVLRREMGRGGRAMIRTPSVVISDHTGETVSLTVALASEDFSLDSFTPSSFHHTSTPISPMTMSSLDRFSYTCGGRSSLDPSDFSYRKVSDCSTCSSVSTVDMSSSLGITALSGLGCLDEGHLDTLDEARLGGLPDENRLGAPERRISDCSTCSNISTLTVSDDEVEQILPMPPIPKASNWRKVRNIVQWTPFIQTYKKKKYPWVQLAGHQGNFRAGYKQGTILKKLCPAEEVGLEIIMKDILRPYVPDYMGVVEGSDGERYLQLQDLLSDFSSPCVMDIKMGVRTYLEEELAKAREKPKLRKDMYEKMVQIDPCAPTEAENRAKAVTKPRYMVWRETISSTATLGFRIEGIRRGDGTSSKDFKTTRTRDQVLSVLTSFLQGYPFAASRYVQRLKAIKVTLEASSFFDTHELIGSSLLFVHNESGASVWMIDFAKTSPLPQKVSITHRKPWSEGTHEDGYLLGMDNLIDLFVRLEKNLEKQSNTSNTETRDLDKTNVDEVTLKTNSISSSSISSNTSNTCNNSTTCANIINKDINVCSTINENSVSNVCESNNSNSSSSSSNHHAFTGSTVPPPLTT